MAKTGETLNFKVTMVGSAEEVTGEGRNGGVREGTTTVRKFRYRLDYKRCKDHGREDRRSTEELWGGVYRTSVEFGLHTWGSEDERVTSVHTRLVSEI